MVNEAVDFFGDRVSKRMSCCHSMQPPQCGFCFMLTEAVLFTTDTRTYVTRYQRFICVLGVCDRPTPMFVGLSIDLNLSSEPDF